jgi:hypothetical protein
MKQDSRYIRWFEEIKIEDIPIVGGKNAQRVCRYSLVLSGSEGCNTY